MDTKALHKISYGLYVIGTGDKEGGKLNAQIANTVIQVCSQPPTIAVCLNKDNLTHDLIKQSGAFSVSVMSQDTPLSFIGGLGFRSGRDVNKLEDVDYGMDITGAPVIRENAIATIEANVISATDAGITHTMFIGEVVAAELLRPEEPMTYAYYQQVKRGTTPKTAPSYQEKKPAKEMAKYECSVCGYIYDPELGDPESNIKPGTPFEDLQDNWHCPVCGAGKKAFKKV
ncbi:MAG: High molecular weight rubredoxin [Planctomycetes bacterium]|nr:High molecular weight rubredoxin [Planctomycetota bacterium]